MTNTDTLHIHYSYLTETNTSVLRSSEMEMDLDKNHSLRTVHFRRITKRETGQFSEAVPCLLHEITHLTDRIAVVGNGLPACVFLKENSINQL